MKKLFLLLTFIYAAMTAVAGESGKFVTVTPEGGFSINGKPYRYIGTNFWQGPLLASPGKEGDRRRLTRELDSLQALGINNLRVLAGAEGSQSRYAHIEPNLLTAPGEYNPDLLEGLDYFLAELEARNMHAVIYLTNSWEWSGGYGTYLEWAGKGTALIPAIDGYKEYCDYASQFVSDLKAKGLYADHVRAIVGRTNSLTGRPYKDSPAIMSWQICNEPRPFSKESKEDMAEWLIETGKLIKSIDPNHLVSTGSEGMVGCEMDIDLWARIHNSDAIDYANIHIWPTTWQWASTATLLQDVDKALATSKEYIAEHRARTGKPLVLEEFGYPRDNASHKIDSGTTARDAYYSQMLDYFIADPSLQGLNFWGWGGSAVPEHMVWQAGDSFVCDPAHEPQGYYSVFNSDTSTVNLIRNAIRALNPMPAEFTR